jgi:hypothetical protein
MTLNQRLSNASNSIEASTPNKALQRPSVPSSGPGPLLAEDAYARDADAIMFEVEEVDKPWFDGPIWIAHIALVSHDIDGLVDFTKTYLGSNPSGVLTS